MKRSKQFLGELERKGSKYYNDFLKKYEDLRLEENLWEALKFVLTRAFMRGRSDTLSYRYFEFTKNTLANYFDINNGGNFEEKLLNKKEEISTTLELINKFIANSKYNSMTRTSTKKSQEKVCLSKS